MHATYPGAVETSFLASQPVVAVLVYAGAAIAVGAETADAVATTLARVFREIKPELPALTFDSQTVTRVEAR